MQAQISASSYLPRSSPGTIEEEWRSPRIFGVFSSGDATASVATEPGKLVKVMKRSGFIGASRSVLLVPLVIAPVVVLQASVNCTAQSLKTASKIEKSGSLAEPRVPTKAVQPVPTMPVQPVQAKAVQPVPAKPAANSAMAQAGSSPASDGHHYVLYKNEPFKYSIEYAADLLIPYKNYKGTEGITLDGVDKQTFMCLGAEVPLHFDDGHVLSVDEVYRNTLGEGGKVLKTEKGKDWFVVSMAGTANDPRYTYVKVIFGRSKTEPLVMKSFRFTYPAAKQAAYQSVIRRMSDSFCNSK